jgi:membrane-associated protease RseP (regulator of RpoE activity)
LENTISTPYRIETLNALVGRIFRIEDVTLGSAFPGSQPASAEGTAPAKPGRLARLQALRSPQTNYIVRYRGRLYSEDTVAAYDQLAGLLKSYDITPLFRWDEKRHAIFLVPGMPVPTPSNPWVNLILFILTLISVLMTGALFGMSDPLPTGFLPAALTLAQRGWPFAVSMLAILVTHEFGHYLAGRYHGLHVTLPYFIPLPFSHFGTLGAFINMKDVPKNRRDLLDVGVAGPLAGLVVALPVLYIGLKLSHVEAIPSVVPPGSAYQLEGNSLLYLLMKFLAFGQLLPQPAQYSLPPLLHWISFFFTSRPLPLGGVDVMISPVAWAGWTGLLVTGLNLIPAGQLDGGHIVYTLLGEKRVRRMYPFVLAAAALLGFVWNGWWIWGALLYFLGRAYAEPLDQITQLDTNRKLLAVLAMVVFILTFTPVPLSIP